MPATNALSKRSMKPRDPTFRKSLYTTLPYRDVVRTYEGVRVKTMRAASVRDAHCMSGSAPIVVQDDRHVMALLSEKFQIAATAAPIRLAIR